MKLLPMTEFVLQQNKEIPKGKSLYETDWEKEFERFSKLMIRYAEFLKRPLALGMFVPVDEERNVLEEPTQEKYGWYSSCSPEEQSGWMYPEGEEKYYKALELWQNAKEKVLFEGFSSTYNGFSVVSVDKIDVEDNYRLSFNKEGGCRQYYSIEELVVSDENFEIELTPSALEAIGIKE